MPASPECQHTEIVPGTNFLPAHAEPSRPGVLPYGDGTAYCCGGYLSHSSRNPQETRPFTGGRNACAGSPGFPRFHL